MANKLLYTYTRAKNSSAPMPDSTILSNYSSSIIFDTDRKSIFTYQTEFGYASHINPGTYYNANNTNSTKLLTNIGVTDDGTITYTYSNLTTDNSGTIVTSNGFVNGLSWTGVQLNVTYNVFRNTQDTNSHNQTVTYVYLDNTGKLHREVKELQETAHLGACTYTNAPDERITGTINALIVNGIKQDKDGSITYNYAKVGTTFTAAQNNSNAVNSDNPVISNIYLSNDGKGTYTLNATYTYLAHTTHDINTPNIVTGVSNPKIVTKLTEDKKGNITYEYVPIRTTFTELVLDGTSSADKDFIKTGFIENTGNGTYTVKNTYGVFTTGNDSANNTTITRILNNEQQSIKYIRGVNLDHTGKLHYAYETVNLASHFNGAGNATNADNVKNADTVANNIYLSHANGTYTLNVTYTAHSSLNYHTLNSTVSAGIVDTVNSVKIWSTYLSDGTSVNSDNARTHIFYSATYTLPTKKYVDELIQANDALRYCGTYTPGTGFSHNSGAGPAHTANSNTPDTSTGALYKVSKAGKFFNVDVTAGDMIISASDSATTSSGTNWDIIQANINLQNTPMTGVNTEDGKRIITNIKLHDSGELTYNYSSLSASTDGKISSSAPQSPTNKINITGCNSTVQGAGVITGVSLTQTDLGTTLSYTYTYLYAGQTHHSNSSKLGENIIVIDTTGQENISENTYLTNHRSIRFITNVNLTADGALSYEYHRYSTNFKTTPYKHTDTINQTYISGVNLDTEGHMSYVYSEVNHVNNQQASKDDKNNYNNIKYLTGTDAETLKVSKITAANPMFISNISLSKDGVLTYTAGYIGNADDDNDYGFPSFDSTGTETTSTTRTSSSLASDSIGNNHAIIGLSNGTYIPIVTNVKLNAQGRLTYTYTYIHTTFDNNNTATQTTGSILLNNIAKNFAYVNNLHIDESGKLSYTYGTVSLSTPFTSLANANDDGTAHHFVTKAEVSNSDGTYTLTNTYGQFTTSSTSSTGANSYIANITLDSTGKLTYIYGSIYHHTNDGVQHKNLTGSSTIGASYISGISINAAGAISYTYSNMWHGTNEGVKHNNLTINSETNGGASYISGISIDANGIISYTYGQVHYVNSQDIAQNSINYANTDVKIPKQANYSIVNNICLTDEGKLTYTIVKVSASSTAAVPSFGSTGNLQTNYTQAKDANTYTVLRNDKAIPVTTYTMLSDTGWLSYNYTHVVSNWGLNASIENNTVEKTVGTYISGMAMDAEGRITYTYEKVNHGNEMLSTKFDANSVNRAGNNSHISLPYVNDYTIVNNIHLDERGHLSYTLLKLSNSTDDFKEQKPSSTGVAVTLNQIHGNKPSQVLNDIRMDLDGSITYTYASAIGVTYWTGSEYMGEIFNDYADNKASGIYSHAEGSGTTASGDVSHAEGSGTTASGIYSHAEGSGTTASGDYSHAEGHATITSNTAETAIGKFNKSNTNQIFSVGVGVDDANRKNAVQIMNTGVTYLNGDSTYICTSSTSYFNPGLTYLNSTNTHIVNTTYLDGVSYLKGTTYIESGIIHTWTNTPHKDSDIDLNTYVDTDKTATSKGEYTYVITGVSINNDQLSYCYEPIKHGTPGTTVSTAGSSTFNTATSADDRSGLQQGDSYFILPADGRKSTYPIVGNIKYDKNGHITEYTNVYFYHGKTSEADTTTSIWATQTTAAQNDTYGLTYAFYSIYTDSTGHIAAARGTDNIHRVDGHHMLVTTELSNIENCTNDTIWFYIGN